jgi:hypothetical protein
VGGRLLDFVREARWLHRERVSTYAKLVVFSAPPFLALALLISPHIPDFLAFWAAAKLALSQGPSLVYDPNVLLPFEAALGYPGDRPFLNPPPYLALVLGLGLLPFGVALALFLGLTFAAYAWALRWFPRLLYWPALAFPAGIVCAIGGQNGFLVTALLVGTCGLLPRHKVAAGLLVGLLIIKPQLAVLAPVAFLAGREWRAFASAAVTVCLTLLLSVAVLGWDTMVAFFEGGLLGGGGLLQGGNNVALKLQTILGASLAFGLPAPVAWALQAVGSLGAACIVWAVWRRTSDPLHRAAALCAATPLATPYLLVYDLPLLVAPVVWITAQALQTGLRPWMRLQLLALWFAPAASIATVGKFPLTVLLCAGMLVLTLRAEGAPNSGAIRA